MTTATLSGLTATAGTSALKSALNLCRLATDSVPIRPSLGCVHVQAKDGVLTLRSTNMARSVKTTVGECEIAEGGSVLVNAQSMLSAVSMVQSPTVTMMPRDGQLQVVDAEAGRDWKLNISEDSELPGQDEPDSLFFEATVEQLSRWIKNAQTAVSKENTRYAIKGVYLDGKPGKLVVVSTDGRRMIQHATSVQCKTPDMHAIVPAEVLPLMLKAMEGADTVVVRANGERVAVDAGVTTVTTSLVEGNFPPYADVIPSAQDRRARAVVDCDELAHAIKCAAVFATKESKTLRFAFGDGRLTLTGQTPEAGEAKAEIELPDYAGEAITLGLNGDFLIDALSVGIDGQATIDLQAPNRPVRVSAGDGVAVVMPTEIKGSK